MRPGRTVWTAALLAGTVSLAGAAPAAAASGAHISLASGGILGDVFGGIGHAVLGAFSWTIGLASRFILTTVGALVRMLIPRSWAQEGVQIMEWIVAVPNYAGTITTPAGRTIYGFSGINALRDLFTWIGVGLLPLTLVYGTTRAIVGERGHVAAPIARVLGIAAVLISYPYWWTEAAAMTDTLTHMVLTIRPVARGLHQLMLYAVDGVALGGWQLIDLALMAVVAIELLSLIFLKVVVILLGALLFATGPITIGLVATESGAAIARAWASAAVMLIALPIVWATLFAVGALLIGDAGTAGPLIAGDSSIGSLLGGVILAVAGAASLWLCLRAAREATGLLRMQLGGLLTLSHRGSSGATRATGSQSSTVDSLRRFGSRVTRAATGAAGELAAAGAGGAAVVRAGRTAGYLGRHGVLGTAAAGGRAAATLAGPRTAALVGRSRAGAVAVRMAKAGTAGWQASSAATSAPAISSHAERVRAGRRQDQHTNQRPAAGPSTAAAPGAGNHRAPGTVSPRPASGASAGPATRPSADRPRVAEPRPASSPAQSPPSPRTSTPPPRNGKHSGRGER